MSLNFKTKLISLVFLLIASVANADTFLLYRMAKPDPEKKFYTIETKNFYIHFHKELEDTAKKISYISETAKIELEKEFSYTPSEKTNIVIMDNNDLVNGFSIVFPYNTIFLNVGFPDLDTTIGEYDNFLYNLFIHEYAHILSMDINSGYSSKIRKIFGKPIPSENPSSGLFFLLLSPPNIFLPRWWHEGVATQIEKDYGYGGRGNKTFYDMVFRMAVYEKNIPSIDRINGDVPYWPKGHTPYIFGYNLFDYLKSERSLSYSKLAQKHSERFPYFINAVPQELLGKDYAQLYEESINWLIKKQNQNIQTLDALKITETNKLPFNYETIKNPRISKDSNKIAFRIRDPHEGEAVVIADTTDNKILHKIVTEPSRGSLIFSPDGNKLFFPKMEKRKGVNNFQSLYEFDITTTKSNKLIDWLRVKDADISRDGNEFVIIFVEFGKEGIAKVKLADIAQKKSEIIVEPSSSRIGQVRWANTKNLIVYTEKTGRLSKINLYDIDKKEIKTMATSENTFEYPVFGPDDNKIFFISDGNGVFNIYSLNIQDSKVEPITHLIGGAFYPEISKNGELIFSSYKSTGFELRKLNIDNIVHYSVLPKINKEENDVSEKEIPQNIEIEVKSYSPTKTVLPTFFLPNIISDHKGSVLGLFTAGQDAIGYHTYTLEIDHGLSSSENYYSLNYLNNTLTPTFKINIYSQPFLYANMKNMFDFWEKSDVFKAEMVLPFKKYFFNLGYEFENKNPLNYTGKIKNTEFFDGNISSFIFGLNLISGKKFPASISIETGRKLSLLGKISTTFLGGELSKVSYYLFYDEYFTIDLSKEVPHEVVHLNLNLGLSTGREIAQGALQIGGFPTPFLTFPLRGYSPRLEVGKYAYTGTVEYRFPISYFYKGSGTMPLFYEALSMNTFFDFGKIWGYENAFSSELKTGIGFELKLDITLGYWLKITPTLGIAKGLSHEGEQQLYFTIYSNF